MTDHSTAYRNHLVLVTLWVVAAGANAGATRLHAQLPDERTRQTFQGLLLQDELLRSSIQGQQIDRQVEIGRLEGRIAKLEKMLRGSSQQLGNSGFISLLMTLDEEQKLISIPPVKTNDLQPSSEKDMQQHRPEVVKLIAQDYMASLKIEILEARVTLFEESQQLTSLERLAAKGLAAPPQLELQQLKQRSAEARYARLEQQQSGLLRLFPTFFSVTSRPQTGDELPSPQPESVP